MFLDNKQYVPTLALRPSEMKGLEFLPGPTKDLMTPCFLRAPWTTSRSIEKAIKRIEQAFHNKNYFLDIDPDYFFGDVESPAKAELLALKDPSDSFANWTSFVLQHEWVWPCIQTTDQSQSDIEIQISTFQAAGRAYCVRFLVDRIPPNFNAIIAALAARGTADYAIILEGGWTDDPLTLSAYFGGMLSDGLSIIDANVPVIVSFTSMPKGFEKCNASSPTIVPFINRQLVEQAARASNRVRVIYGDWGSTRPREAPKHASAPLDRIDYPTESAWHIGRNKDEEWDFEDAAKAILNCSSWDGNLGVWGEEQIRKTAINMELGIDTPQKNVASRVNIHLHRQAFFGAPPPSPMSLDEDWED